MVTRILATTSVDRAHRMRRAGGIGVVLYEGATQRLGSLGARLLHEVTRLPCMPPAVAWDFLSIALAAFAADRFVLRSQAADGWTREIELTVELSYPAPWNTNRKELQRILKFLTGDFWKLKFQSGGAPVPTFDTQLNLGGVDCICLFSGGLDSFIGVADLLHAGRDPLVVSQPARVEVGYQNALATVLGIPDERRFGRSPVERYDGGYEPSTRARSILFLAYGLIAASAYSELHGRRMELIVPENGFIALNPPLTLRRIGSLSTRTTHPYFLDQLQGLWDSVGLRVDIENPYRGRTKGEMMARCRHPAARRNFVRTYSCGKGKRLNMQCGSCLPCLIRRAAFHAARIADRTKYYSMDLDVPPASDDLYAARFASARSGRSIERWVAATGPLPSERRERSLHLRVARRGLAELRNFLE